ncbi:MAG TPA: hypothetical protein VM781_01315, partial [Candidatus Bathyarchaeia archaeon]|nr:hypothetical protein [Candidatus Bathyarchaeia archaeon]
MKRAGRHPIWSWVIHTPWVLALLAILAIIVFFGSGVGNPIISRLIVQRLEAATGTQVELGGLSIRWLSLRFTLKGLVIHGKEPAGTEPLFSAEEVQAGLRIVSFWGRKVSLDELIVQQPHIHIRVEKNGSTNIPAARQTASSNRPIRETLFDLSVRHIHLKDGWILYNEVKAPLAVEGDEIQLALDAGGTPQNPLYLGNLDWKSIRFTSRRYTPLPVGVTAKFTLWRDGFTLEQGVLTAGRSRVDAQGEMSGFAQPKWTFRYRGWVDL